MAPSHLPLPLSLSPVEGSYEMLSRPRSRSHTQTQTRRSPTESGSGHDRRPTSVGSASMLGHSYAAAYRKNLWGWYLYAFASEVFVIVSLTLFLPICLEQYARDNGFLMADRSVPCSSSRSASVTRGTGTDILMARSTTKMETRTATAAAAAGLAMGCVVKIGWAWVDTTSFSLYVYSISVALQAITVISMGGIADHPPHRKRILLGFASLGSLSAILFFFLPSTSESSPSSSASIPASYPNSNLNTQTHTYTWLLSAPLAMLANIGLGASVVAMNAYIPALARRAPEVVGVGVGGLGGAPGAGAGAGAGVDDSGSMENENENEDNKNDEEEEEEEEEESNEDSSSPYYSDSVNPNANANDSTPLLTSPSHTSPGGPPFSFPPRRGRDRLGGRRPQRPDSRSNTIHSQPSRPSSQYQYQYQYQYQQQIQNAYQTALSRTTARISSYGIAIGYGAGISVLALILFCLRFISDGGGVGGGGSGGNGNGNGGGNGGGEVTKKTTEALRMAIGASGVWWALFTIPAGMWLPDSDHLDDPIRGLGVRALGEEEIGGGDRGRGRRQREREMGEKEWNVSKEIGDAWIRLGNMLRWREMNKLRNTFRFLAAWFLLSDGLTTISSTTLLFSKTTLQMSPSSLVLIGLLTPTSGILSSLLFPYIQRRYGFTTQRILFVLGIMASFVPAYGVLGLFVGASVPGPAGPVVAAERQLGWGWGWGLGLTTQAEMYVVAVYFGAVYAAFQGYARAFYAELLPPSDGARWYALFSIAGKSSSFIGPLVVGLISDTTGNIRYSFFFLVFMIWAALPVLASVDVERGRRDAVGYEYESGAGDGDIDGFEAQECVLGSGYEEIGYAYDDDGDLTRSRRS